ncbi:MAG: hypothetical protein GY921_11920, partial [Phycisphaeraceae bacterium]|nr:hypothetical protein [Phycisphaeraceae bacterium]
MVNRVLIAHFDHRTGHARAAGPGEFSARAFLTGRLTIRDATGIAASIAAARDEELDAADRQRRGPVAAELRAIGDRLADAIARTEAGIDFSDEEDVVGCSVGELRSLLAEIRRGLDHTEQWLRSSRPAVRDEPLVALVGPPNAGKSTLFNALTGGDRVVVSEIAGTTRDAIEASVALSAGDERRMIRLIDTAGLGSSADPHQEAAEARTRASVEAADLVVWCVPNDLAADLGPSPASMDRLLELRTKADLPRSPAASAAFLNAEHQRLDRLDITLSREGRPDDDEQGVESLVRRILGRLDADGVNGEPASTEAWRRLQATAVTDGASSVDRVDAILEGRPDEDGPPMPELVVAELLTALESIRRL